MPVYVRGMVIPDVALTHRDYQKLMLDLEELVLMERRLAVEGGGPLRAQATIAMRALASTRNSYRDFNQRLRKSAIDASVQAVKGMERRLSRHDRPPAGGTPTLASLLRANPLPPIGGYQTGAVGVADVAELNKAVNRHSRGFGPYWRAIEYGTGQHGVPSQVGRVIFGSFMEAGGAGASAPMAQYAGGGGPHPVFISGYRPGVGASGLGTIGKEIEGKHFIGLGADEATVQWRQEIMAMQQRAIEELAQIRLRS